MAGKNIEDKDLNKVQGGIMSHMGMALAYGGPDFRLPKFGDVSVVPLKTEVKNNINKNTQGSSNNS